MTTSNPNHNTPVAPLMAATVIMPLATAAIRIDGGTQARAELNQPTVAEYAEAIAGGAQFPPIIVFFDGSDYWLGDGYHRLHAHNTAGKASIDADVRQGTQRDAVLYSVRANASHGLRRSNADKRKAVAILLTDAEWGAWSDNRIAQACGVDHKTVAAVRGIILGISQDDPAVRTVERAGTVYQQKISKIGKRLAAPAAAGPEPAPTVVHAPNSAATREQLAQQAAEDAHGDLNLIQALEDSQREIEELQKTLKAATADDKAAEAAKYQRIAAVSQQRQNELQATVNDRDKELTRLMSIVRRCGKAVGEEAPHRVAATVESRMQRLRELEASVHVMVGSEVDVAAPVRPVLLEPKQDVAAPSADCQVGDAPGAPVPGAKQMARAAKVLDPAVAALLAKAADPYTLADDAEALGLETTQ